MPSVLIVDDLPENLYFLEVLLKGNDFAVYTASNGAEALESARKNPPDLVISDILMPVLDGYALCRAWRADERLRQIPFIFYTATFIEKKDESLALSLGADRFVVKPQEPDALMVIVREVLVGSAARVLPSPTVPVKEEEELLREYNAALFRKLEKKMADLEGVNKRLQESEESFRQFIVECPVPIAITGGNGTIELVNNCFMATIGYTLADIPDLEAWWHRAYPEPVYREQVIRSWAAAMEDVEGKGGAVEDYYVTCKDGTVRCVEITGTIINEKLLVILHDLTERRRMEKERAEIHSQMILQDKMASIGQLAAGVFHEINNPIAFIRSNLETLAAHVEKLNRYIQRGDEVVEQKCPPEIAALLAQERAQLQIDFVRSDVPPLLTDCFEGAERIISIIQELKVFVHRDTLEAVPVDLNRCCDTVISIVWNEIRYVATLKKEYGEIPLVVCNSQQISQVLMNLVVNAAQAIKEEGEIIVRTWADEGAVFVSIADNGCGIPPEDLPHIFEAFYTTKEIGKGTGLGLSISAEIIKNHHGEITVMSNPGKGSTFTVRLPGGVQA